MTILNDMLDDKSDEKEPEVTLETLVGEGKKYATAEELAKAYAHADNHIRTLIEEKRNLESQFIEVQKHQLSMADLIKELKGGDKKEPTPQQQPQAASTITPEQIAKMVDETLQNRTAEQQAQARKEEIKTKLATTFGDLGKAVETIKKYTAGDNNKTVVLDQLLMVDFDAAVKLLQATNSAEKDTNFSAPIASKRTTPPPSPTGLTWSACEKIRKENPKMYRSREFQLLMHRASQSNPTFMNT
jgi:hypothetical protein